MPSFDIQSKVDAQVLDNAINIVKKEIQNRYDFKGTQTEIELDKKTLQLKLAADNDMQMAQLIDILITKSMRQGLDAEAYDLSKNEYASGKVIRKEINVKNGLDKDDAKKVVKLIKDSGLKVQAAIMDDLVRVTGKKIDDLQEVIALCKNSDLKLPLQFVNMKS